MNELGRPGSGSRGAVLALLLWIIVLAPQWVLMSSAIRSADRLRAAVAHNAALKLLAMFAWMASVMLAFVGTVFICRDVLGPELLSIQRVLANATLVQEGLLVVVGLGMMSRRRRGSAPVAPVAVHRPLGLAIVAIAILAAMLAVGMRR